jgi:hypothetical protein
MVKGRRGLRQWEDSVYFFQSESRNTAFQQALEIGLRDRHLFDRQEGQLWVETRLARIVSLDDLGTNPTDLSVRLGARRATERLPFEHEFHPERGAPVTVFRRPDSTDVSRKHALSSSRKACNAPPRPAPKKSGPAKGRPRLHQSAASASSGK